MPRQRLGFAAKFSGMFSFRAPSFIFAGTLAMIYVAAVTDSWKDPEKGLTKGTPIARVDVIETKGMQNRMVEVKAEEMEKQIATTGRVALYGVFFDTNEATLKSESDATLAEVQKLMASDPKIKILVVGHTDNIGEFEFNRDLSNRRATAVVKWN